MPGFKFVAPVAMTNRILFSTKSNGLNLGCNGLQYRGKSQNYKRFHIRQQRFGRNLDFTDETSTDFKKSFAETPKHSMFYYSIFHSIFVPSILIVLSPTGSVQSFDVRSLSLGLRVTVGIFKMGGIFLSVVIYRWLLTFLSDISFTLSNYIHQRTSVSGETVV